MTKHQDEMYNWGQEKERVFADVPMKDAFAAIPNYSEKELYNLGLGGTDGANDAMSKDYMITE